MTFNFRLAALVVVATLGSLGNSFGQTAGIDEAVRPDGAMALQLSLTPLQRSEIYNAVMEQRVRSAAPQIAAAVGAPVPPSVMLEDLPPQVAAGTAGSLKYAMVAGEVVVVDPVSMRVVDVIHGASR